MAIKLFGGGVEGWKRKGGSMQNVLACTTETDFNNKSIDPLK